MNVPYALTDRSITVVLDCVPHAIDATHPNFDNIRAALSVGAVADDIRNLIDLPSAIADFMSGNIEIHDRVLYYKGEVLDNSIARYILHFIEKNEDDLVQPVIAFLDNVMENPSYRAIQGLFDWVQKSNLPITPDGHLLAWKIVGDNYRDLHSGRFDNSVGQIVEQARNLCDEDPDRTCSAGLHFCSYDYLPHYGNGDRSRIMVVKINPRDVVAFPRDYNTSKGRCCRYEVIDEVPQGKVREYFPEDVTVWSTLSSALEVEVGQKWRDRDGNVWEITESSEQDYLLYPVAGRLVADDTRTETWTADGEVFAGEVDSNDLVELVEEVGEFPNLAVGQVWQTQDGRYVTVEELTTGGGGRFGEIFILSDGEFVWESNGDILGDTEPGEGHLKRLISDAI